MPPRRLAAPLHKHSREDEYSYVLEGRMGAMLGDDVVYAEAGDTVFKPRDQWHTFWNAGDSPAGSSRSSRRAGSSTSSTSSARWSSGGGLDAGSSSASSGERYGIEFQPETVARAVRGVRPRAPAAEPAGA